ncbi:MAG: signal peptidase II [Planctomycetota bacterium]
MTRLLYRYRWFLLLVVVCTAADLATKAMVFHALGVTDDEIRQAVTSSEERYAAQLERYNQVRATNPDLPAPPPFRIGLPGAHRHEVIDKRVYFDAVLNAGAFGGLLGGQIMMLVILSVVAVGIVGWMLLRSDLPRYQIVGGLIIAGAFGNIYDRLNYSCVRDFVEFRWPEIDVQWLNPWNTFNFADSCIVIGIIGLLILEFFFALKPPDEVKPESTAKATTTAAKDADADAPSPAAT